GHVVGLEHASMHDQHLMTGGHQVLDRGPADESGAAEDDDPHAFAAGFTAIGFLSTIRSINPQAFACSGVMKKSRSIARSTSSSSRPQCLAYSRASCSRWRRISWAWIWMSVAWPWMPCVCGWWMRICAWGNDMRMPSLPPASRIDAPLAARPVHSVATFGPTYCIASYMDSAAVSEPPGLLT